ncbi:MAG: hypothetical protein IPI77_17450 [Saprospiraceae bacterium]|nr:hypothetical protein [Saprospiraceae bacterium]
MQIFIRESGSQLKISIVDNGVGRSYSNTAKNHQTIKRSMGISLSTDRLPLLSLKDEAGKIEIWTLFNPMVSMVAPKSLSPFQYTYDTDYTYR